MNQRGRISNSTLILLAIVIVGALGYVFVNKKILLANEKQSVKTAQDSSTHVNNTASLDQSTDIITDINIDDIVVAQDVLIKYFDLLNSKEYDEAIKYHGSGYSVLEYWNPNTDVNDYASLLKHGCESNGLRCLKIKNVISRQQISSTEFNFVVQFENNDGSLFEQGPCCGATEEQMPTKTDFGYKVKKIDDLFLVMTGPIYTP